MKQPTEMGMNRTGMGMSPMESKRMMENTVAAGVGTPAGCQEMARLCAAYIEDAEPIGTVPPPSTLKGAAAAAVEMLRGKKPNLLIDKLGERLAFERTGARLYDMMITKVQVVGGPARETTLALLRKFREDEIRHFDLVWRAAESIGADPTVMTPGADVAALQSHGLLMVLGDARTNVPQCMQALLVAELVDNDSWTMLVDVAEQLGNRDMAERFRGALREEEQHLAHARSWLRDWAHQELS